MKHITDKFPWGGKTVEVITQVYVNGSLSEIGFSPILSNIKRTFWFS